MGLGAAGLAAVLGAAFLFAAFLVAIVVLVALDLSGKLPGNPLGSGNVFQAGDDAKHEIGLFPAFFSRRQQTAGTCVPLALSSSR
jgi:hypothetical protein